MAGKPRCLDELVRLTVVHTELTEQTLPSNLILHCIFDLDPSMSWYVRLTIETICNAQQLRRGSIPRWAGGATRQRKEFNYLLNC